MLEFKVDYRDIVGIPMKVPIPNPPGKDKSKHLKMNYILQLELINNGYGKFFSKETAEFCEDLRKKNEGICFLALKIRSRNLIGKDLSDDEQMELLDKLALHVENKLKNPWHY